MSEDCNQFLKRKMAKLMTIAITISNGQASETVYVSFHPKAYAFLSALCEDSGLKMIYI